MTSPRTCSALENCDVIVVGAGLSGCEASWQMAQRGLRVGLIEQKPLKFSPAHKSDLFAELVCSNSLKSQDPLSAPGLLKSELLQLDSLILKCALAHQVAAGQSLAVDRTAFSQSITNAICNHPNITIHHLELQDYRDLFSEPSERPCIIATGPLGSEALMKSLEPLLGTQLSFYDAISPILDGGSIDHSKIYKKNRYDKVSEGGSDDDYLNCPLEKDEYLAFIEALKSAEKMADHSFEKIPYFQGCQPIEAMLEAGPMTLAFGPMKPMGLENPRTGRRPFAVVQLRREDSEGRAWNMVGFQTKMKYPDQKRVFSMIPGLESAEFFRLGSIHRNTYLKSPMLLASDFSLKNFPALSFAGQITGVEGYLESTAIGAYTGLCIVSKVKQSTALPPPPETTALGALVAACYKGNAKNFQPMNMNWGLVPLNGIDVKDPDKKQKLADRARRNFRLWSAFLCPMETNKLPSENISV